MELSGIQKALLRPEVQDFVFEFSGKLSQLAFSGSPFEDIPVRFLLEQIEGHRRIAGKLPLWHHTKYLLYPPRINLEQASSSLTAQYKCDITSANEMADITGGFGVDSYFFSKAGARVSYCEKNKELAILAQHNFKVLGIDQVAVAAGDGLEAIKNRPLDLIYVDPSRRHDRKGKVLLLEDCEPNLPAILKDLFEVAPKILVKTSPMLDIAAGIKSLGSVSQVHVVAVSNEVKELVFLLERHHREPVQVIATNLHNGERELLKFEYGTQGQLQLSKPDKYLYEPNAAIMKSGGLTHLCDRFGLGKLHANSHLFTAASLTAFPGRVFEIIEQYPYNKRTEKYLKTMGQAHISCRNFPLSPPEIRKRLKLKDGGQQYLFFTTGPDEEKIVLLTKKLAAF